MVPTIWSRLRPAFSTSYQIWSIEQINGHHAFDGNGMGDWSFEPWGTDEAADWFARFWKSKDIAPAVEAQIAALQRRLDKLIRVAS